MRIVYLSHFHPPTHNAGIEQNTHNLAKGMLKAGHQVAVVCMQHWDQGDSYWQGYSDDTWEGVPVRRLKVNWRLAPDPNSYLVDNPVVFDRVRDFLLDFKPDLVHIASMYTLSTSIIRLAHELDLPVVLTLSDFWLVCPRHTLLHYDGKVCDGRVSPQACRDCLLSESRLYRRAKRLLPSRPTEVMFTALTKQGKLSKHIPGMIGWGLDIEKRRETILKNISRIDHVVAPSRFILDTVQAVGLPLKAEVSHYGNHLDWLEEYSPRPDDGEIHFGYMGQIIPIKGLHLLIRAFLENKFPGHVKLFIYGKTEVQPDYTAQLLDMTADNPNIRLMGGFNRGELPQVLSNIDVLVVPSIWPEVAGLVVQEAFAARIPVLASNMGGLPEFVRPGEGGLLFDVDDHRDLQKTLAQVVDGAPESLHLMRNAVPRVRSVEDERNYMENVYTRLITRRELA